jgi:phenylacetate-CoA ligase
MFKLFFNICASILYPNIFKYLSDYKLRDNYSKGEIRLIREEKLSNLLIHFKNLNKFYSSKINNINSLENIDEISKKELIKYRDLLFTRIDDKVKWVETSGTSGETILFPRSIKSDTINRAFMFKSYDWYGVKPWERNGYLWGFNKNGINQFKIRILDFFQNRFRLFSYDDIEIQRFLIKLKSSVYLHGYSSMIYEIAKQAQKLGFSPKDFPKLKLIKGTSEKIYPYYQDVVLNVFGRKIISEYGAAEAGIIAFECPNGSMHINEENVFIETDQNNEIIVTNLNSFVFPIIRYKLGDYVKVAPYTHCDCGRQTDIITEIEGRVGKKIFGKSKSYPSLTLYYIFKNIALKYGHELQYQGFQKIKGHIDLRFPISISINQEKVIYLECLNYFNNDIDVNILSNYDIHDKKSKLKDFISEISDS